jgi:YHS domain-containing protein
MRPFSFFCGKFVAVGGRELRAVHTGIKLLKRRWKSIWKSCARAGIVLSIPAMKSKNGSKGLVLTAALALAGFVALTGCQSTHDDHTGHDHSKHSHGSVSGAKAYPLTTCIVSDEKLDKDATTFVYQGQELKTCCEGCKEDFDKEPAKYLKKLAKK